MDLGARSVWRLREHPSQTSTGIIRLSRLRMGLVSRTLLCSLILLILFGCDGALDQGTYEPRSGVRFSVEVDDHGRALTTLTNLGSEPIGYGYPYEIETLNGAGQWEVYKTSCMWILPLLFLKPGDHYEQEVSACRGDGRSDPLPPGSYRVIKDIEILDSRDRIDLVAEFEVPGG